MNLSAEHTRRLEELYEQYGVSLYKVVIGEVVRRQ